MAKDKLPGSEELEPKEIPQAPKGAFELLLEQGGKVDKKEITPAKSHRLTHVVVRIDTEMFNSRGKKTTTVENNVTYNVFDAERLLKPVAQGKRLEIVYDPTPGLTSPKRFEAWKKVQELKKFIQTHNASVDETGRN